jgi:hypothetical protein
LIVKFNVSVCEHPAALVLTFVAVVDPVYVVPFPSGADHVKVSHAVAVVV